MSAERLLSLVVLGFVLAAAASSSGCESLQRSAGTMTDILEKNADQIIKDPKDREKWLAGARAVRNLVTEIDTPQEIAMGQSLAVRTAAGFGRPHPDEALQRYVAKVGKLVALQSERPTLPYSFAVVESNETNALALPGGYVFVTTGLLKTLHSESELACILAHEVCHVAQKHGVEIVSRDRRIGSLVDFGAVLDEDVAEYRQFIDLAYDKLTREGYDRRYEWIADEAGTIYAYRAGYHPGGLLPFLEASRDSGGRMAFEVFKTHPDPSERIRRLRDQLRSYGDYSRLPKLEGRYRREALDRLM